MPKYYRFRATTPTRKSKRCKVKEREKDLEKSKAEEDRSWLDLTLACNPAPSWYLRRTCWRETPPIMGLPRLFGRASLQLSNRPVFFIKLPRSGLSHDFMGYL